MYHVIVLHSMCMCLSVCSFLLYWLVSNFPNHFPPSNREVYELKTNNPQTLTATHVSCSLHLVSFSFLDILTCETRPHPFSSWRETIFSSVTVSPWFVIHSVQYRIKNFNSLIFDILVQIAAIFHMQYIWMILFLQQMSFPYACSCFHFISFFPRHFHIRQNLLMYYFLLPNFCFTFYIIFCGNSLLLHLTVSIVRCTFTAISNSSSSSHCSSNINL